MKTSSITQLSMWLFATTEPCRKVGHAPFAVLLAFVVLAFAPGAFAGNSKARLMDFVEAQDGGTEGFLYVPPVPNFLGWNAPDSPYGLSIDYTGLANKTCGAGVGTKFGGSVKEEELADGRALVSVKLITKKAIAWMIDLTAEDPNPFGNNPTIFGTRWDEECNLDGPLALGHSILEVQFINSEVGAPMPNIFDFFDPETELVLLKLAMKAVAVGEMTDGTRAVAGTRQLWEDTDDSGTVLDNGFTIEEVFLHPQE